MQRATEVGSTFGCLLLNPSPKTKPAVMLGPTLKLEEVPWALLQTISECLQGWRLHSPPWAREPAAEQQKGGQKADFYQWPCGGRLHLNRQQLARWGRVGNLIRAFIPSDGEMCLFKLLSLSQSNELVLAGTPHQSIPERRLGLWKQISTLPSVLPLSSPHRRKQDK